MVIGLGIGLLALFGYLVLSFFWQPSGSESVAAETHLNLNHLPVDAQAFGLTFTPVPDYVDGFASFGVWSGEEKEETFSHPILLETPQDRLNATLTNETALGDVPFLMKVFYNYEEAHFRVGDGNDYVTEFVLTVPSRHSVEIPFYLDSNFEVSDTSSHLTVGIFLAPERHAFQDQDDLFFDVRWDLGQVLHFEINYGYEGRLVLPTIEESDAVEHVYRLFGGFAVNQDDEPLLDGVVLNPPELLQVSPNEEVELFFISNMHEEAFHGYDEFDNPLPNPPSVTDILVISMLDWRQIPMNGEPYTWVSLTDDPMYGQHGRFMIEAPSEPGFYEFIAFLVPNPTAPFSWDTFFSAPT